MIPIDYSTLITSFCIAVYGGYQYIKREKEHRILLQRIVDGKAPALYAAGEMVKPALWRLLTLTFVEALLVGSVIWLVYIRSKILYAGEVAYVIAFFFATLFLALLPMLVRDIKTYRNS